MDVVVGVAYAGVDGCDAGDAVDDEMVAAVEVDGGGTVDRDGI